jgi:ABC-type multidrug transport system fused ATPase/permease subunit
MQRVLSGRSSVVIAHRLSTIRNADRILVLSGGRLVEEGNHGELIKQNGLYAGLYRLQYEVEA